MSPRVTVEKDAWMLVINGLGFDVDPMGYVVTSEGELVVGVSGENITKENFGGVEYVDGEALFVEDNFNSVCAAYDYKNGYYKGSKEPKTYEVEK